MEDVKWMMYNGMGDCLRCAKVSQVVEKMIELLNGEIEINF
jgi:hypothetical protein